MQQKQINEIISTADGLEKYIIKKLLGLGASGQVYLVELMQQGNNQHPQLYAMKVQANLEKNEEDIIKLLINNPSPNLLNIKKYWQTNGTFFLLMDLASDGNLYEFMEKNKNTLTSKQIQEMFHQLCLGLSQLHKLNIIHRDLKPENILLQPSPQNQQIFTLKICDFGLSKKATITATKNIGTIYYMAPELIQNAGGYTKQIDIWALGCIWYSLVAKDDLFTGQSLQEIQKKLENITQQQIDNAIEILNLQDWEKKIMKSMINIQFNKRPNMDQILQLIQQQINPQKNEGEIQNSFNEFQQELKSEIKSLKQQIADLNFKLNQELNGFKNNYKDLENQQKQSYDAFAKQISGQAVQIKDSDQLIQQLLYNKNSVEEKITNLESNVKKDIQYQSEQIQQIKDGNQKIEIIQQEIQQLPQTIENIKNNLQKQIDHQILELQQNLQKQIDHQYMLEQQQQIQQIQQIAKSDQLIKQIEKDILLNKNSVEEKITNLESNVKIEIQNQIMIQIQDRDQQFKNLQQQIDQLPQTIEKLKTNYQALLDKNVLVQEQIEKIQKQKQSYPKDKQDEHMRNIIDDKKSYTQNYQQLQNMYLNQEQNQNAKNQNFEQHIGIIFQWINFFEAKLSKYQYSNQFGLSASKVPMNQIQIQQRQIHLVLQQHVVQIMR